MRTESFHLGDLLSITTGRLLSPDHMDGIYRLVDYLTGVPHLTHQLPRAADECKPYLLEQHPWLKSVDVSELADQADATAWMTWAIGVYGEWHEVEPVR